MPKLVYIQASPRNSQSTSHSVAAEFLKTYQASHAEDLVETIDLWEMQLPEMTGRLLDAAYAAKNGQNHTAQQANAWQAIVHLSEQFRFADKYLLSVPMWNFSIPYKLKHYIDLLVHSGLTFSFTPELGYQGLVTGKPLAVIYSRGGAYGPGSGFENADQQSTYVKQIFGFIGFTDIQEVFVEPTAIAAELRDRVVATATQDAVRLAETF